MTQELDDAIYERVTALTDEANELFDRDDAQGAIGLLTQALDLLPDPKTEWEAYTWINGSLGDAYFSLRDYEKSQEFLRDALNGPEGFTNPFILLRLGEALYETGYLEAASEYLTRAYMLEGENLFEDEDPQYLAHLKTKLSRGQL